MDPNASQTTIPSEEESSEKYIRTFASDMDISKKGGTPGLIPLKRSRPEAVEPVVPPAMFPIAEMPEVPIKMPEPAPAPAPEFAVQKPAPFAAPPAEPAVPLPPEEPPQVASLETYSEDFRERMKETQASTATVLAAEQDARPRIEETPPEKSERSRNLWYVIGAVLLLVAGGVGVYFAYSRYLVALAPIVIAPAPQTPIFVDSHATVSGTGKTLIQAIEQSVGEPLALNTVRQLSFDISTSTGTDVFTALDVSAPGILLRNLNSAGAMAGVVHTSGGQSPFFILSVGSYSATFSGMLSWEPTIQSDLAALFPLYPTAATSTATSTALSQGSFRDEVVSNHDVRVYRDSAGRSVLLYGYWDQATLIIARDPSAFVEITERLATSHT